METRRDQSIHLRSFHSSEKSFLERAVSKQFGKEEFGIEERGKYGVEK